MGKTADSGSSPARWQFRVRELFVLMSVVAIELAMMVHAIRNSVSTAIQFVMLCVAVAGLGGSLGAIIGWFRHGTPVAAINGFVIGSFLTWTAALFAALVLPISRFF